MQPEWSTYWTKHTANSLSMISVGLSNVKYTQHSVSFGVSFHSLDFLKVLPNIVIWCIFVYITYHFCFHLVYTWHFWCIDNDEIIFNGHNNCITLHCSTAHIYFTGNVFSSKYFHHVFLSEQTCGISRNKSME